MRLQKNHLTALLIGTLTAGIALAQTPDGNRMDGTKKGMMKGRQGHQVMAGPMMQPDMMHGMSGTMNHMHQMMQRMSGIMEHHGRGMDMKSMGDMSKMMDDMGGMMQAMAARMRDGKMDHAMLKTMNERLEGMGKSMQHMEQSPQSKK